MAMLCPGCHSTQRAVSDAKHKRRWPEAACMYHVMPRMTFFPTSKSECWFAEHRMQGGEGDGWWEQNETDVLS